MPRLWHDVPHEQVWESEAEDSSCGACTEDLEDSAGVCQAVIYLLYYSVTLSKNFFSISTFSSNKLKGTQIQVY